jgi:hypothetical protein
MICTEILAKIKIISYICRVGIEYIPATRSCYGKGMQNPGRFPGNFERQQ